MSFEDRVKARIAARQALGMSADEFQEFTDLRESLLETARGWKSAGFKEDFEQSLADCTSIVELYEIAGRLAGSIRYWKAKNLRVKGRRRALLG